jgi:Heat induced stress protein YflT
MRMSHPLVLALFDDAASAARAAKALRQQGVARERVSIVARTHDEEGAVAAAADASPGSEIEDSAPASRLGELGAHVLSAMALVMPGIGPIVADGPLAAGLGEAAGHLAGGIARTLTRAGLPEADAAAWERRIDNGAFLLGAHTDQASAGLIRESMQTNGATTVAMGSWIDAGDHDD